MTPRASPHNPFSLEFSPSAPRALLQFHFHSHCSCRLFSPSPLSPSFASSRPGWLQPLTQELHGEVASLRQQRPADNDFFGRVESIPHDERDTCGGQQRAAARGPGGSPRKGSPPACPGSPTSGSPSRHGSGAAAPSPAAALPALPARCCCRPGNPAEPPKTRPAAPACPLVRGSTLCSLRAPKRDLAGHPGGAVPAAGEHLQS